MVPSASFKIIVQLRVICHEIYMVSMAPELKKCVLLIIYNISSFFWRLSVLQGLYSQTSEIQGTDRSRIMFNRQVFHSKVNLLLNSYPIYGGWVSLRKVSRFKGRFTINETDDMNICHGRDQTWDLEHSSSQHIFIIIIST